MGSLIAIVSFIACVSGFGGVLWVATKRGQNRDNHDVKTISPITQPPTPDPAMTSKVEQQSSMAEVPASPPAPVPNPEPLPSTQATSMKRESPIAPDPWLDETSQSTPVILTHEPVNHEPETAPKGNLNHETGLSDRDLSSIASHIPLSTLSLAQTGSNDLDSLQDAIAHWGETGKTTQVTQFSRYINHIDPDIRSAVASAIGAIATRHQGKGLETIIPQLGKLSRDGKPDVSVAAVEALGQIRSKQILPWLQQALKHPNPDVIKAASSAIQTLKFDYGHKPQKAPKNHPTTGLKKRR
jgi:hypothetical protein